MEKREEVSSEEIERFTEMVDLQMSGGVNRLSVKCTENEQSGILRQKKTYGKRDAWNPWNWGETR